MAFSGKAMFLSLIIWATLIVDVDGQQLVSSTFLGAKTQAQLISQFNVPFIQFGAKYYKITYTSTDAKGAPDTLSGLLVIPSANGKSFPRLVYQHGTSDCKTCVPSRYGSAGGGEGDVGLVFAGMGYIALLPDYVGMGDGRGFQAYVHAKTEAFAAIDMLGAATSWLAQNDFSANNQLFITGYSQGGHAAMALHRALELDPNAPFAVTAAAHLSGPYSVSGVMRNLILSQSSYLYPAYIPNTALSYQNVYGNIYTQLSDLFKPEYATLVQQYYQGSISLGALNTKLIQTLTINTGASVPRRMIQDAVLQAIENDPQHPINLALRDNDVFRWGPKAPTRIFYCTKDDQVPYLNSIVARDSMPTYGAQDLQATDVSPNADHGACVTPALTQTLLFFAGFQQITSADKEADDIPAPMVSPNPAQDYLYVSNIQEGSRLSLADARGVICLQVEAQESRLTRLDLKGIPPGHYVLRVQTPEGGVKVVKVVVQ